MKRKAFTTIFENPIPFTPKFNENGIEETKKTSTPTQSMSFATVRIYRYLLLFMVTKAIKANCARIEKIFAILSILIYCADASIIVKSVAIVKSNGFAKAKINTESMV